MLPPPVKELKATTQRDCSAVVGASSLTACVQLFGMHRGEFEGYTYWVALWKGPIFPLTAAKPMLDETAEKSGLSWKLGSLLHIHLPTLSIEDLCSKWCSNCAFCLTHSACESGSMQSSLQTIFWQTQMQDPFQQPAQPGGSKWAQQGKRFCS